MTVASSAFNRYSATASGDPKRRPPSADRLTTTRRPSCHATHTSDPRLATAGHHSSHPRYALQEAAWRALSAAGLYALAV